MADDDPTQGQTAAPTAGLGLADAPPAPKGPGAGADAEAPPAGERPPAEQDVEAAPEAWWRQAENFDQLREHEHFQTFLSDHDEEREHELRTELGRRESRIARAWAPAQQATAQALETVGTISRTLERAAKAGLVSVEDLEALTPELQKIGPQALGERYWSGVMSGLKELTDLAQPGFYEANEADFWDLTSNADYKTVLQTLWDRLMRQRDKKLRAEAVTELEKRERARKDAETRQLERERQAPPARTGGGVGEGGKSDRNMLLDPNTPIETIREIRARQRAGGG